MAKRFIDISVRLESEIKSDPPIMLPEIEYHTHKNTAEQVCAFFSGLKPDDLWS